MSIETTLSALAAFPPLLATQYAQVPVAYSTWSPPHWEGMPSEHFTPLGQLLHVRDIERDGYHVRIGRTLTENGPVLADIDSYALAEERDYAAATAADAEAALADFAVARARTVKMLSRASVADLARAAEFEGYGPTTLRGLAHLLCSHDQQHLAGLHWLLARIAVQRDFVAGE
ncbi:DinB family protein [Arenimonas sp.]|uniref:DinB family protein n=1 Tax=Arenimonas sp. TaxID=1872635 RepID=UPI0039E3F55C